MTYLCGAVVWGWKIGSSINSTFSRTMASFALISVRVGKKLFRRTRLKMRKQ